MKNIIFKLFPSALLPQKIVQISDMHGISLKAVKHLIKFASVDHNQRFTYTC